MAMFSQTRLNTILSGVEPQIVTDLRQYLIQKDMVILIDISGANPLTEMLCRSEALRETTKRIVIISTANFPIKLEKHTYRTVSEKEMRALLEIYRSYEASDKLFLLSDSRNYGSTWNYVNNGLISMDEMFEAMFG